MDALAADVILKVRRPDAGEIGSMKRGSALVGFLEPYDDDGTLARLAEAGVDGLSVEQIPRISRSQSMDALSSQANISGYRAVIEASAHYARFFPMMMTAAGSARPARVIVLGAGVAGLQAIATARRLGAEVEGFDVRPEVKEQIESLGAKQLTSISGKAGPGRVVMRVSFPPRRRRVRNPRCSSICRKQTLSSPPPRSPGRAAPVLITPEALPRFKPGSVIVDLAAASGGNCPLTEADRVVVKDGVTLVGHTNYPAMVPGDASAFYAKNLLNLLALLIDTGNGAQLKAYSDDEITRRRL